MEIASADRRPVDPPPIVDLRVFEVYGDEKKDITCDHQVNFFLYTTLEHARPMNQGRVPVSAATLPVLTGTPVAGMSPLERPKPAGYFIFPDLSVRHEGKYRLSFNLYEELKNPEKDAEPDVPVSPRSESSAKPGAGKPRDFVHFRMEVKSGPFDVFSAKKFPGLAESTLLSRTVNEQGCRVRIRRDVRMRRRDKPVDGYKELSDDLGPTCTDRYPQVPDRPRSTSAASTEVATPYSTDRRQSYHDIGYYQQGYPQSQPTQPQSAIAYTPHLSFGGSGATHYQTPTMAAHPQPPMGPIYAQAPTAYSYGPQTHTRQLSGPHNYGYQVQPPQPAPYVASSYSDERGYPDSRRSSGTYSMSQTYDTSRTSVPSSSVPSQMRPITPIGTTRSNQGPRSLPPIKTLVPQSPIEVATSEPKSTVSAVPHGPYNPFSTTAYSASTGYHSHPSATSQSANPISASQSKRAYGDVFDASPMNQPMYGGMRPNVAIQSQDLPQIETADGDYATTYGIGGDDVAIPLIYKRADGSRRAKKCPSPRDRFVKTHVCDT